MITLFVKRGCPYCEMVLDTAHALGIEFTEREIHQPGVAEELIQKGGKRQMPYMVDDARGVSMYESEDIAAYLKEHYPKGA